MTLIEDDIYHIYNRGNNRQQVFFSDYHYMHFIKLMKKNICPYCEMLAWCLMPNHFHFLICANQRSVPIIKDGSFERQRFSQGVKQLLSSYTKAINEELDFTGSRFQQKTKGKNVTIHDYARTAFHYIHQNPIKANLVDRIEDWPFSSFHEYVHNKKPAMCNKKLAFELLDIEEKDLYEETNQIIEEKRIIPIFERVPYEWAS